MSLSAGSLPGMPPPTATITVDRWPGERNLLALVVIASIAIWTALCVSIIGIVYAGFFAVFFFMAHVGFVAHLRGSAVRLGPSQMPELHGRVVEIARRFGMQPPAAYLMQSGGALNAMATRFFGSRFIVLYSDLLEACGDNEDARDFIVAHELGHLKAGHLTGRWFLMPGLLVPFLGTAWSRACEYTCDRYGRAGVADPARGLDGLVILAAGGRYAPRVDRRQLAAQQPELDTFWMAIGRWLSTHPPIAARLAALDPGLAAPRPRRAGVVLAAAAVIGAFVLLPIGAGAGMWAFLKRVEAQAKGAIEAAEPGGSASPSPAVGASGIAESRILSLADVAEDVRQDEGAPPADIDALYKAWSLAHPGDPLPIDPYDGRRLGYRLDGDEYVIWSIGPDPKDPDDDITYDSSEDADDNADDGGGTRSDT